MQWIRTIILHAMLAAAIFSPAFSKKMILAPDDGLDYFVPAMLSKERMWDPYLMCGFPVHADPQTMLWYPLRPLAGGIGTWNLFVISAFVLSGAFMHRWIAYVTKSEIAGAASGVCAAYGGFLVSHLRHPDILHTMAWIPLVLLGIERLRERPSRQRIAATALAGAAAILAGHPQILAYLLLLTIAYAFFTGGIKTAAAASAAWALAAMLAAVVLVPSWDLASRSVRSTLDAGESFQFSMTRDDLQRVIVSPVFRGGTGAPEAQGKVAETTAFTGMIAAALALYALAVAGRRARFWAAFALLAMFMAFGSATMLGRIVAELPGFDRFRAPGRHLAEFHLAMAALAGMGVARIARRNVWAVSVVLLLLIAEMASFALHSEWRFRSVKREAFDRPLFLEPIREELMHTGDRIAPFMGIRGSKETGPPNRSQLWKIPSTSGYNPLRTADIAALLQLDLRAQFEWELVTGPHRGLDLAAAKYLTSKDSPAEYVAQIDAQPRFRRVASIEGAVVFENRTAMPRAWLAREAVVLPRDDIRRTIESSLFPRGDLFDPRWTALFEESVPNWKADAQSSAASDSVALELEDGRIVRIRTSSAAPRILVVSDAHDPGWNAKVDGRPARIQRCDFMFLGIPLEAGDHVIELAYRSRLFLAGAVLSLAALVAAGGMLLIRRRHPAKSANPPVTIAA